MNQPPLILVVDDDWMNRELLEAYLQGYEVLSANSGEKALELVASRVPDLIIADVRMPGMDGYELCVHLRAHERTRITPILMMTGLNAEDSRQKAFEVGADDILSKPFDSFVFLVRVRLLLRLKKLQDQLIEQEHTLKVVLNRHLDESTVLQVMTDLLKTDA